MDKKKITIIISIITILLLLGGGTYALYTLYLDEKTEVNFSATGLKVNYTKGTDKIGGTLNASSDRTGGINTEVELWKDTTDNLYGTFYLNISTIGDLLKGEVLKWEIWQGQTRLGSGNFTNRNSGDIIKLAGDIPLSESKTLYTVYVWLDDSLAHTSMKDQTFSGTISVTATNDPTPSS